MIGPCPAQVDYPAGVLPVGNVDCILDALPEGFMQSAEYQGMNDGARGMFSLYDADAMHGLPLAVQVAGGHLEEEQTLEGMKIVQRAMAAVGRTFVQPDLALEGVKHYS